MEAVNSEVVKVLIKERCKDEAPVGDGIVCPHCNAKEVYKNSETPGDTNLWYWMIRAFKVDDYSECRNCKQWFGLTEQNSSQVITINIT